MQITFKTSYDFKQKTTETVISPSVQVELYLSFTYAFIVSTGTILCFTFTRRLR